MTEVLSKSARRVHDALRALGCHASIQELATSTRTAEEAAAAVGCDVAQIVKSLVFRGRDSDAPILALASGANRVDEKRLAALVGEKLARADADFVRERTGYAIGGVPPVGHASSSRVFIDADLVTLGTVWAAAGNPRALFAISAAELIRVTEGQVGEVKAST